VESDGPAVTAPTRRGFGSTVIRASIERQLKGALILDWLSTGLFCCITVPGEQLLLPKETAARPLPANEDESLPGGLNGQRILVVEDEPLIALNLEQALTDAGCASVALVPDAAAALARIDSEQFDGAVLDINLGLESSFSVADALAARGVPFAFCTGYTGYIDVPERHSRAPVLSKPFRAAELTRAVREMSSMGDRQGNITRLCAEAEPGCFQPAQSEQTSA
jgi:CheY-like chemotaxis protein